MSSDGPEADAILSTEIPMICQCTVRVSMEVISGFRDVLMAVCSFFLHRGDPAIGAVIVNDHALSLLWLLHGLLHVSRLFCTSTCRFLTVLI